MFDHEGVKTMKKFQKEFSKNINSKISSLVGFYLTSEFLKHQKLVPQAVTG